MEVPLQPWQLHRPQLDDEKPLEKPRIWLLEWQEPWDGGAGAVFKHKAFWSEKKAVEAGKEILRSHILASGERQQMHIERLAVALEHRNQDGNHYALQVFIKPVELE